MNDSKRKAMGDSTSDPLSIQITEHVEAFRVPEVVRIATSKPGGGVPVGVAEHIPLNKLSSDTLHILCDRFKRDVFRKAGKSLSSYRVTQPYREPDGEGDSPEFEGDK